MNVIFPYDYFSSKIDILSYCVNFFYDFSTSLSQLKKSIIEYLKKMPSFGPIIIIMKFGTK